MNISDSFTPSNKKFYEQWKAGLNVRDLYSKQAFYRHKLYLLDRGIDISKPYSHVVGKV